MRRIVTVLEHIQASRKGLWAVLSLSVLIVLVLFTLQVPRVCSGQEGLKKWLSKTGVRTAARRVSDKRVVESMLETLRLRESELLRKEQEIEAARKSLKELERRLKEQMAAIEEMHKGIESLLKKAEAQKQMRIDELVSLYGTMDSQNAAAALLELFKEDKALVAAILKALEKKRAAAIFNAITSSSPEVAADITRLIGRYR